MNLLTVKEAAALLRVSRSTLYCLLKTGKLPFITVGSSKGYRFSLSDLEEFIDGNRKVFQTNEKPKRQRKFKHLKP